MFAGDGEGDDGGLGSAMSWEYAKKIETKVSNLQM